MIHESFVNILVIDDHEQILYGVKSQLQNLLPNAEIDLYTEVEKVIFALKQKKHDLYILDIELKEMDGFQLAQEIRNVYPEALILFNTLHEGIWYRKKIMALKMNGIVFKSASSAELGKAVVEILNGNTFFCMRYKELNISQEENHFLLKESFTQNEREILHLIAKGLTSKEIALKKVWSVKTVEHYRKRLFDKFGVTNVSRLIALSMKEGFLKEEDV